MTMMTLNHKCDTCGKPATRFACDIQITTEPEDQCHSYVVKGGVKAGCADHPVRSFTYNQDGEVVDENTDPEGRAIPR